MPTFKLKATSDEDSIAIIQTFHSEWHDDLINKRISTVFRKLGPNRFTPTTMYAYVSSPISAIVARARIASFAYLDIEEAIAFCKQGRMREDDLRTYARGFPRLLVMHIRDVNVARRPITYATLSTDFAFFPSSTFIPIGRSGVSTMDRLGRFDE
jgi:predicted transcriptional regulator